MDLLVGLNPAQKEAVTYGEGPMLVLAGPGSGKTRVITHRVAYLIQERCIPPHRILAVTFTNKAADEMYHRLERLAPGARPFVSTFHKFCARILRQYATLAGLTSHFTILDQGDKHRLLAEITAQGDIDTTHIPLSGIERSISQLKNDLVSPESFAEGKLDYYEKIVAKVYSVYQERLLDQNAVDFDDLLYHVANLLRQDATLRRQLDQRFEYVLVDEYQDTNLAQYAIARGLSVDHPNLCATGDPDQSIYSWRGANLNNILKFEEDFPGAHCVRLEENYRSTGHILSVADALIRHNVQRKHKDLITKLPPGEHVTVRCYRDEDAEASAVAESIRLAVESGERKYRDFAVLVRVNSLTRPIEAALKKRHIPYQVLGGYSFFERKEIRDILAYCRLLANPLDDVAFSRVINVPARGVGKTSLERLHQYASARHLPLTDACREADQIPGLRGKPYAAIRDFRLLLDEMQSAATLSPADALELILDRTQYREYLEETCEYEDAQERLGNIEELLTGAQNYSLSNPEADFVEFLETVSLVSDADQRDDASNQVTVMTLHAAKGLEFPVVHLIAFEEDVLPHQRAVEEENTEEERRLLFVGITRAQRVLCLSYALRRFFQGRTMIQRPSPFLHELPVTSLVREDKSTVRMVANEGFSGDSYDDFYEEPSIQIVRGRVDPDPADRFCKGMMVNHPEYGLGMIMQVEGSGKGRKATIQFSTVGPRRCVLSCTPLEPVEHFYE